MASVMIKDVMTVLPYLTVGAMVFAVMRYKIDDGAKVLKELKENTNEKVKFITENQTKLKENIYKKISILEEFKNENKPIIKHLSKVEDEILVTLTEYGKKITAVEGKAELSPSIYYLNEKFPTYRELEKLDEDLSKQIEDLKNLIKGIK